MRASSELALVLLAAAVCLPALGCKSAPSPATSPGHADVPADMPADDSTLLLELDRLERELDRLGLRPSGGDVGSGAGEGTKLPEDGDYAEAEEQLPAPTEAAADRAPPSRSKLQHCSDVCDLSQAICDLEGQICALAESHREDSTYASACRRASEDCELASRACEGCGS